jgi:hypothetical protein
VPGPAGPADRYDPLPGLLGLPGHLYRKLSPNGRRVAVVVGVLLLAGLVATAIVLAPRISDDKRERAAEERAAHARAQAAERARLVKESRPRRGRLSARTAPALVAGVEAAITRDAVARAKSGEFGNPARRTDCNTLGRRDGRLILECTAVTSDVKATESSGGVIIGYPYRAAVAPGSGRYGLCRISGQPGEGLLSQKQGVPVPHACGG